MASGDEGDKLTMNAITRDFLSKHPEDSAYHILTSLQKRLILAVIVFSIFLIFRDLITYLLVLNFLCILFYILFSAYKLFLITLSLMKKREITFTSQEIVSLRDNELPLYTILVPLYRERETLKELVKALDEIDYPKDKLDIQFLLEENDEETISFCQSLRLTSPYRIIIIPHSFPKTKPKACNIGLSQARGEFLVIYDAEDRPEPDQLKKAVLGFGKVDNSVICLQAKLNFYNQRQNWLTRWFTTEYSMWFDLFLPGLAVIDAPIPLGGTSNHFKTESLRELGGWDPFNVTEDCDLGVRLHKKHYRTQMIDSTTWEEACSNLGSWIRQRSRWVKGYIQTYLVHMRHPLKLLFTSGSRTFINFHLVVGGTFFCFLVNPVYWILTLLWFFTKWNIVTLLFPLTVFIMGTFCLFIGNFVFVYAAALGSFKRGYFDLVKYALLTPFYWALMSIAAWKGCLQLFFNPHYWEKTTHGLFLSDWTDSIKKLCNHE